MNIDSTPFEDCVSLDIMPDDLREVIAKHTDEMVADLISEDYRAFVDYIQLSVLDYTLTDSRITLICMQFMADFLRDFAFRHLINQGLMEAVEETDPETGKTHRIVHHCSNADLQFVKDHRDLLSKEITTEEEFQTAMKCMRIEEKLNQTFDFTDCLMAASNRLYCAMNDAAHASGILE